MTVNRIVKFQINFQKAVLKAANLVKLREVKVNQKIVYVLSLVYAKKIIVNEIIW